VPPHWKKSFRRPWLQYEAHLNYELSQKKLICSAISDTVVAWYYEICLLAFHCFCHRQQNTHCFLARVIGVLFRDGITAWLKTWHCYISLLTQAYQA